MKHAWEVTHEDKQTYRRSAWIAERLYVEGSPKKKPSPQSTGQLLTKMDDPEWFPGKICGSGSLGGRPLVLSETKRAVIARSAMSLKEKGVEPTYPHGDRPMS